MNMPKTPRKNDINIPPAQLDELAALLRRAACLGKIPALLGELLTPRELHDLALRLRLLQMLCDGVPQRKISAALGVSLCKVTRGSRILKDPASVVKQILQEQ